MAKNRHVFVFNPNDNGGECITLVTEKDIIEGVINQEFSLQCYGTGSASIQLGTIITPDLLRKCANELEKWLIKNEMEASSLTGA